MPFDDVLAPVSGTGLQDDATAEADFDEIATLAATLCRTPQGMALLRQVDGTWTTVSRSRPDHVAVPPVLLHAVMEPGQGVLVIEDTAQQDEYVVSAGESRGARFFAGLAFLDEHDVPAGVLCVLDRVPRVLTAEQETALALLGRQLQRSMQLMARAREAEDFEEVRGDWQAKLRASEELFRTFMNASPFLSYIKDAAGRLLFYNRMYARRFGISEYAWLGRTDDQLWARGASSSTRISDIEVMQSGRMVESEEQLRGPNDSVTHWRTYKFPCYDSSGNMLLAGLAMETTEEVRRKKELERFQEEMQQANEQLRRLSVTDELTRLRNRRAFEERLLLEFSMSRRRRRDLAVLLIDVDDFKRINDRWGHPAGDTVLRRLASILRTTVRLPDLVARYGGEEFVVLLPESNAEAGQGFSRRLMQRIATETWEHEPVTISIGIAALNDSLLNGYQLVSMADEALYAAKRNGKNQAVCYGAMEKKE